LSPTTTTNKTKQNEMKHLDHKSIGQNLELFHFQEESQGNVFWHHKGYVLYKIVEDYIREVILNNDYIEVKSPQLLDSSLWKKSGHWDKYKENMFIVKDDEEKELAIKPMNCPCHVQIFNQGIVSYKELPIRMSEFGSCHRNEMSGSLNGLFRMRGFVQDDAHIFCSEEQIVDEVKNFFVILLKVYSKFGFEMDNIKVMFSDRPDKRIGSDELWDMSESSLLESLKDMGFEYGLNEGDGAFYGPKIEFVLRDNLGRDWQCGVLQLDFNMPQRLDAFYVDKDGSKKHPVMIHRAILGSMERFIGILLEHHQGKLPFWLSPEQVVVSGISNELDDYCGEVHALLKENGIRSKLDLEAEPFKVKVAKHYDKKIPYICILGKRELESKCVAVKDLRNNKQEVIELDKLIEYFKDGK